jgi:TrmH RNA methyltransferase
VPSFKKLPPPKKQEEPWLYGVSQCQALFAKRRQEIKVILYSAERRFEIGPLLQYAASQKLPYREVPTEELTAASNSIHHEGICIKAPLPKKLSLDAMLDRNPRFLLALDRVSNPHNVGAILRSAAYFGVDGVILPEDANQADLSPAVLRTSEGGGEYVPIASVSSLGRAQVELKRRNIGIIGADAKSPISLYDGPLPRPCALLVGNEGQGLSEVVRSRCDKLVSIPGTGQVDSLNVSVATAIFLAEAFRTKP